MEDDEILDKLVHQILELDLIPLLRDGDQSWPKADSKVVGVHHVFVAISKYLIK